MYENNVVLSQEKKLTVVFRVESGCLGPTGADHIEEFCRFAQKKFESIDSGFMHWEIIPRHDKTQPEIAYRVKNKNLDHDKAEQYLEIFKQSLDAVEEHLHENLTILIDQHLCN
jgi:hypothetical protein